MPRKKSIRTDCDVCVVPSPACSKFSVNCIYKLMEILQKKNQPDSLLSQAEKEEKIKETIKFFEEQLKECKQNSRTDDDPNDPYQIEKKLDELNTNSLTSQQEFYLKFLLLYFFRDETIQRYGFLRQGTATNKLARQRVKAGKNTEVDYFTGNAIINPDTDYQVFIHGFNSLVTTLRTTTNQLLDAITLHITSGNPKVTLSVTDYMELRGLKDRKEARKQIREDLETLSHLSLQWSDKKTNTTYGFMNIADSGELKGENIIFTFAPTFFNILEHYPPMLFPTEMFKINSNKNPNSYNLGRKIAEHKRMNAGKENENIISVKTLLECCPYIPAYDDVMSQDRQVLKRIILPFERDLDFLEEQKILSWHYCHSNNTPLSDEELPISNYSSFIEMRIYITWYEYPDQTKRLKRKAAIIKKAKKLEMKKNEENNNNEEK